MKTEAKELRSRFPFLTTIQSEMLISYCEGIAGVDKCIRSKVHFLGGMKLTRIPSIGTKTAKKILNIKQ